MKITIIGASGHGKVVAEIAKLNGYDEIEFLDDNPALKSCGQYPVVGKTNEAGTGDLFVAIGNAEVRMRLMHHYKDKSFPVLIHPNAVIASDVKIGEGSVIMAGAIINPGTTIGEGVIVNTCSSIDHDCVINDFTHISVGSHLCGTVKVGHNTWIGAGTIINNNISICNNCVIGSSSLIIRDIREEGTYFGVPAVRH